VYDYTEDEVSTACGTSVTAASYTTLYPRTLQF
jgi:hypothetical protein